MVDRAEELVATLGLIPHPEGGYYGELYRSGATVHPTDGRGPRAALTTIYFLLPGAAVSRWHRVQSDEVWHFYEGAPLDLCTLVGCTVGPGFDFRDFALAEAPTSMTPTLPRL